MEATLNSLTDSIDGTFHFERNAIDSAIERTNSRIQHLTTLMENRKTRLLNQFVAMENVISSIQSQQTALQALQVIKAPSSS